MEAPRKQQQDLKSTKPLSFKYAQFAGAYPPILDSTYGLAPMVVRLFTATWAPVAERIFANNATALFSWADVGQRARYDTSK